MRTFLLAAATGLLLPVHGQITIGQDDMPGAGDIMTYRTATALGIDVSETGAGITWDYSDLDGLVDGADTAVTVGSTPLLYQFFFNNQWLYPDHAANFAMKGQAFSFQVVNVEDVYDYYKKGPTGYRNVGFGATINSLPASVQNEPVDWIYRFPMAYGDEDSSYSTFAIGLEGLGYYGRSQWRHNTVDGWGTIILPGGASYEVLRVRSVLDRRDTLYAEEFGFGFGFDEPQTVEYKWIAQGMDAPVFIVTTLAGVATTARYHYDPLASVEALISGADLEVYPVPACDEVRVNLPDGWDGHLLLFDASGRKVEEWSDRRGGATHRLDLTGIPAGVYALHLTGGVHEGTRRLVIEY